MSKKALRLLDINIDEDFIDFHVVPEKKLCFIYKKQIAGIPLVFNANLFKFSAAEKIRRIFQVYDIPTNDYRLIIDDEPLIINEIKYFPLIKLPLL
jgi:hypothetical protein